METVYRTRALGCPASPVRVGRQAASRRERRRESLSARRVVAHACTRPHIYAHARRAGTARLEQRVYGLMTVWGLKASWYFAWTCFIQQSSRRVPLYEIRSPLYGSGDLHAMFSIFRGCPQSKPPGPPCAPAAPTREAARGVHSAAFDGPAGRVHGQCRACRVRWPRRAVEGGRKGGQIRAARRRLLRRPPLRPRPSCLDRQMIGPRHGPKPY
jgi:hypothetical protein